MTPTIVAAEVLDAPVHTPNVDHKEAWGRAMARLRAKLGEEVYESWFASVNIDRMEGGAACLTVPTQFLKKWITGHYANDLLVCIQAEFSAVQRLELLVRTVATRLDCRISSGGLVKTTPVQEPVRATIKPSAPLQGRVDTLGSPLDPRHTFETFMVGRGNMLAHGAAKQVALASQDGQVMFNPLYIYAGVGVGKTHLLQAIAWAASAECKVLYLTAEKFVSGLAVAIKNHTTFAFKEALRAYDLLVIDDLQFLQGKSIQVEFCHMLNAFIDAHRQVVVGTDRPPLELEAFDSRTRSRLGGGLVVEMGPLHQEIRLQLLKLKLKAARASHAGFDIPEEVLAYLAQVEFTNGRDLEGMVNHLLARVILDEEVVTLQMAERAIEELVRPQEPRRVKIEDVQRVVARQYNVSRSDILSSRRTANVVRPRQVAMYLSKVLTLRSLPEIGRRFGGRDHTTVLHAVRKIDGLVGRDASLAEEIELLKKQIRG